MSIDCDKVFNFNNKLCRLKENASFVTGSTDKIDYRFEAITENTNDTAIGKLNVYNENKLIFSGKLYSI